MYADLNEERLLGQLLENLKDLKWRATWSYTSKTRIHDLIPQIEAIEKWIESHSGSDLDSDSESIDESIDESIGESKGTDEAECYISKKQLNSCIETINFFQKTARQAHFEYMPKLAQRISDSAYLILEYLKCKVSESILKDNPELKDFIKQTPEIFKFEIVARLEVKKHYQAITEAIYRFDKILDNYRDVAQDKEHEDCSENRSKISDLINAIVFLEELRALTVCSTLKPEDFAVHFARVSAQLTLFKPHSGCQATLSVLRDYIESTARVFNLDNTPGSFVTSAAGAHDRYSPTSITELNPELLRPSSGLCYLHYLSDAPPLLIEDFYLYSQKLKAAVIKTKKSFEIYQKSAAVLFRKKTFQLREVAVDSLEFLCIKAPLKELSRFKKMLSEVISQLDALEHSIQVDHLLQTVSQLNDILKAAQNIRGTFERSQSLVSVAGASKDPSQFLLNKALRGHTQKILERVNHLCRLILDPSNLSLARYHFWLSQLFLNTQNQLLDNRAQSYDCSDGYSSIGASYFTDASAYKLCLSFSGALDPTSIQNRFKTVGSIKNIDGLFEWIFNFYQMIDKLELSRDSLLLPDISCLFDSEEHFLLSFNKIIESLNNLKEIFVARLGLDILDLEESEQFTLFRDLYKWHKSFNQIVNDSPAYILDVFGDEHVFCALKSLNEILLDFKPLIQPKKTICFLGDMPNQVGTEVQLFYRNSVIGNELAGEELGSDSGSDSDSGISISSVSLDLPEPPIASACRVVLAEGVCESNGLSAGVFGPDADCS